MGLDQVAVLAGDPVALDHLRSTPGDVGDLVQLTRRRAHADNGAQPVAERGRVELGAVAPDHAVALESLQPLGHRRRGQADAPPEFGQAQPRV